MAQINVISLFDGISCGNVALNRAGISVNNYYASEIDENAMLVAKSNYPNIIQFGDVKNITPDAIRLIPQIDLLIGGSPCTGYSRAGKHLNFADPESSLIFNYVSILDTIRKRNNRNVKFLLENVEMKTEWKNAIDALLGVEGVLVNSKLVSAQNRPRCYWTNFGVPPISDKNISLSSILEKPTSTVKQLGTSPIMVDATYSQQEIDLLEYDAGNLYVKQATKAGKIIANDGDCINLSFPTSKTRRGRVIAGKSATIDKSGNLSVYSNGVVRKLTVTELERLQTLPDGYTKACSSINERRAMIGNGWTVDVIAAILKSANF